MTKLEKTLNQIVFPKPIIAGTIAKLTTKCGNPACNCALKVNPIRHPFTQLTYKDADKRKTVKVKKADLQESLEMSDNYKQLRQAVAKLGLIMIELNKKNGIEKTQKKFYKTLNKVLEKGGAKSTSGHEVKSIEKKYNALKLTNIELQKNIQKMKIRERDLVISREKWKAKESQAKTQLDELKKNSKQDRNK